VVACLPSKCEALSSLPSAAKKKKERKRKEEGGKRKDKIRKEGTIVRSRGWFSSRTVHQ
jgi:hypothetical protein